MIITLDNAYQSELLLQPARNNAGELKGLEVTVNFTGVGSDVRIPTELVIPRLTPAEELALFQYLSVIRFLSLLLMRIIQV